MQRVKNLLHKIYYVKIYSKREVQLFNIIINPLITSYNFFIIKTSKKLYILYKITIFIYFLNIKNVVQDFNSYIFIHMRTFM